MATPQPTTTTNPTQGSSAAAPNPAGPGAAGATSAAAPQQNTSGSLYVGDLLSEVTEALLFEIFNPVGPVSSIRVCRDAATRRSLGYAYVNFHNVMDAERALDTINFTKIKAQPCRIMWSHRDPSIRKSAVTNIFIKNLDKSIDNKSLYDTFSAFGNILSCKVATDAAGASKGYGFVHYEADKGAKTAIEKVNGMLLAGKKVYVGRFERRSDRPGGGVSRFTNVYVKNIPEEWDEAEFRKRFSEFGKITSIVLQGAQDGGKHKGFGFVNYETHDEAVEAVKEGVKICVGDAEEAGEKKFLYVDRFQKKGERTAVLTKKFDDMRREKNERFKNLNLYVKNIEDTVDDATLKEMFEVYGEISSVVVMKDDKSVSRGFGFVCFTNPDHATKALQEMNGKMIGQKPIYVNRAQRKEERRMQLESQFQANMAGHRMQPMAPVFYAPPGNMAANMMAQPALMYQQHMINRRFPAQPSAIRGAYPVYPQPMKQRGRGPSPGQGRGIQGSQRQRQRPPYNNQRVQAPGQQMPPVQAPLMTPNVPATNMAQGQELTTALTSSTPEMQKQLLGERLFPLVQAHQPELAGKITGMLLEMEVTEILGLLDRSAELEAKVNEAVMVLQSHMQPGDAGAATADANTN